MQVKITDYDYAVNDYYGNEQTRREHIEPGKQVGHGTARMAGGAMKTNYEAGAYGNLAHVIVRHSYFAPTSTYEAPAPAYSAPAPAYSAPAPAYTALAPAYSHESYTEPSAYETPEYSIMKVVDYDYAVNDYYGNEQSKREHHEAGKAVGEYRTRMPDGTVQVVSYYAGPHGYKADVQNEKAY